MQPDVNDLIALTIQTALEDVIQGRCSVAEASDIRFALSNPEPELTAQLGALHGAMVDLLVAGLPGVLNVALFGDE